MSPERTRARPVLNVGPRSVSVRAVAADFYALAEDAAQVSVAQGEGTPDAKALAE